MRVSREAPMDAAPRPPSSFMSSVVKVALGALAVGAALLMATPLSLGALGICALFAGVILTPVFFSTFPSFTTGRGFSNNFWGGNGRRYQSQWTEAAVLPVLGRSSNLASTRPIYTGRRPPSRRSHQQASSLAHGSAPRAPRVEVRSSHGRGFRAGLQRGRRPT